MTHFFQNNVISDAFYVTGPFLAVTHRGGDDASLTQSSKMRRAFFSNSDSCLACVYDAMTYFFIEKIKAVKKRDTGTNTYRPGVYARESVIASRVLS